MKKFILVMVFALLIALFIAFNYLIWDRESNLAEIKNLQTINASYDASISVQKREINSLEEEVSSLRERIRQLEQENEQLLKDKDLAVDAWNQAEASLRGKIDFINVIKEYTDIQFLANPVILWAEAINSGNFQEAYQIEYESLPAGERTVSLAAYTERMKVSVTQIEITDIRIDKLRGSGNGDIYLNIRFNVKLPEDVDIKNARFAEGENEMYVKVDYSKDKKAFIISSMNIY
jgi:FtsZ-binding cell division protein ZapB